MRPLAPAQARWQHYHPPTRSHVREGRVDPHAQRALTTSKSSNALRSSSSGFRVAYLAVKMVRNSSRPIVIVLCTSWSSTSRSASAFLISKPSARIATLSSW